MNEIPGYLVIPFPLAPTEHRSLDSRPVQMYPELIERLGFEETITYLRIALWHQRGEESSIARLAEEVWFGDGWRAEMWVSALCRRGLVQEEAEWRGAAEAEWEEEQAASARHTSAKRRRLRQATYHDGRWSGTWPLNQRAEMPAPRVPVVYFQYDADDRLAYIGSTDLFTNRMRNQAEHRRSDVWVRWEARECGARDEAYAIENREIEARDPYQNRPSIIAKQARKSGGAR